MNTYILPKSPEILSMGIKSILLSINNRANITEQSDYNISERNNKNVYIYFLFLYNERKEPINTSKLSLTLNKNDKIIIITQINDVRYVPILKSIDFDALISAVEINQNILREILYNLEKDQMYIHPFYISEILKSKYDTINKKMKLLTTREFEIIDNMLTDKSNSEIANTIGTSIRTVNAHKRNILKKFGAKNMEYVVSIVCQYGNIYR